tara:strand:- start:3729 stop:4979 length:1251 start_codon:yes stop_codon:yes gene_type:complete
MITIYSHQQDGQWYSNFEKAGMWPIVEGGWTTQHFMYRLKGICGKNSMINLVDYQLDSENGYYLIHAGNAWQLIEHNGLAFITPEVARKINSGKLKLLVAYVFETFDDRTSLREWYWDFCLKLSRAGINRKNSVVFLTSTSAGGTVHPGEERCVIAYYPWFEADLQCVLKTKFNTPPGIDFTKKTKKFINLNSRPRSHRFLVVMYLCYRGLLQDGHISWTNYPIVKNLNEILLVHGAPHWGPHIRGELARPEFSEFSDFVTQYKRLEHLTLDFPADHHETWHGAEEYYQQSWTELINETHFELFGDTFLTEKSFKSIFYGLPYIINGPKGQLQTLKNEGYLSFPEIFNEDYDSMPCNLAKITNIGESMNILCHNPARIELINTPEILEKLEFNQQHFWKKDHNKNIHDLLEYAWNQ